MDFTWTFTRFLLLTVILFAVAARGAGGDDFANNLATDLAPLLALFGERVTTEFLSQSLGWLDCLILALGPLGIITTLISAVRVGGPSWMKAIIGRSRENLSIAEMELMSSTSHECCELWNGRDVVRCQGQARIKELIFLFPQNIYKTAAITMRYLDEENDEDFKMSTGPANMLQASRKFGARLANYVKSRCRDLAAVNFKECRFRTKFSRLFAKCKRALSAGNHSEKASKRDEESRPGHTQSSDTELPSLDTGRSGIVCGSNGTESHDSSRNHNAEPVDGDPVIQSSSTAPEGTIVIIHNKGMEAPNIALNRHDSSSRWPSVVIAVIGAVLQGGALLYFGFITYYPTLQFLKDGHHIPSYGFPMTAIGTLLLVLGMFLCALVVDRSTVEKVYKQKKATNKEAPRLLWLQSEGTVSDQLFESYALYPRESREQFKTSERRVARSEETRSQEDTTNPKQRKQPKIPTFDNELFTHTIVATGVCLVGFITQFVGLRAMHWSASIGQLIVVAIMTVLRVLLREPFRQHLESHKLERGYELDKLALALAKLDSTLPNTPSCDKSSLDKKPRPSEISLSGQQEEGKLFGFAPRTIDYWTVEIGRIHAKDTVQVEQLEPPDSTESIEPPDSTESIEPPESTESIKSPESTESIEPPESTESIKSPESIELIEPPDSSESIEPPDSTELGVLRVENKSTAQGILETRQYLAQLVGWEGPILKEATVLAKAMEETLNELAPDPMSYHFSWTLRIHLEGRDEAVVLDMVRENQQWKAKLDQLEAVLSLWIYAVGQREGNAAADTGSQGPAPNKLDPKSDSWVRAKGGVLERGLMLIGPTYNDALLHSLRWWLPPNGPMLLRAGESEERKSAVRPWRIVGNTIGAHNEAGEEYTKPEHWSVAQLGLESDDSETSDSGYFDSESEELGRTELHNTQEPRINPETFLAVDQYVMLPKLYARHLFNAFAWQATSIFEKAPDAKWVDLIPRQPRGWTSLKVKSDQLARLAQRIQESGLQSVHEAYISLIPPIDHWSRLSDTGYLVDFSKAVEKHVQESGWESKNWYSAADLLVQLVRIAHGHDKESYFRQRANGMLVTHLQSTLLLSKFCLSSRELPSKSTMRQLKRALERYVRHDFPRYETFLEHKQWFPDIFPDKDTDTAETIDPIKQINDSGCVTDHLGWTVLHCAAQFRHEISADLVSSWLDENINANARDFRGWTSLHYACCRNNLSAIKELVRRENTDDAEGFDGMTPTHCIAASEINKDGYERWRDLCQRITKNSLDHELLKDVFGRVPLHIAVLAATTALEFLGGVNERDNKGQTPLHLAVISRDNSIRSYFGCEYEFVTKVDRVRIARKLLERGADANAQDDKGRTPLHCAVLHLDSPVSDSDTALVQELLQNKANIDARDRKGRTCLMLMIEQSNIDAVKVLLGKGARTDLQPELTYSALRHAIESRSVPIVELLLQHDASLAIRPHSGRPPLEQCAWTYTQGILHLLIDSGASLTEKNKDGRTILCQCAFVGLDEDFVHEIIRLGAPDLEEALEIAREEDNDGMVNILEKAITDRQNPPQLPDATQRSVYGNSNH